MNSQSLEPLSSLISSLISSQPNIQELQEVYNKIKGSPAIYLKQMESILLSENMPIVKNIVVSILHYVTHSFISIFNPTTQSFADSKQINMMPTLHSFVSRLESLMESNLGISYKESVVNCYIEIAKLNSCIELSKTTNKLEIYFKSHNTISAVYLGKAILSLKQQYLTQKVQATFIKYLPSEAIQILFNKGQEKNATLILVLQALHKVVSELMVADSLISELVSDEFLWVSIMEILRSFGQNSRECGESENIIVCQVFQLLTGLIAKQEKFGYSHQLIHEKLSQSADFASARFLHLNIHNTLGGQYKIFIEICKFFTVILKFNRLSIAVNFQNMNGRSFFNFFFQIIMVVVLNLIHLRITQMLKQKNQFREIEDFVNTLSLGEGDDEEIFLVKFLISVCEYYHECGETLKKICKIVLFRRLNPICQSELQHLMVSLQSQFTFIQQIYSQCQNAINFALIPLVFYNYFRQDINFLNTITLLIRKQLEMIISHEESIQNLYFLMSWMVYFEEIQHGPAEYLYSTLLRISLEVVKRNNLCVFPITFCLSRILQKYLAISRSEIQLLSANQNNRDEDNQRQYINSNKRDILKHWKAQHISIVLEVRTYLTLFSNNPYSTPSAIQFAIQLSKIYLRQIKLAIIFQYQNSFQDRLTQQLYDRINEEAIVEVKNSLNFLFNLFSKCSQNNHEVWLLAECLQEIAVDENMDILDEEIVEWIRNDSHKIIDCKNQRETVNPAFDEFVLIILTSFAKSTKNGSIFFNTAPCISLTNIYISTLLDSIKLHHQITHNHCHFLYLTALYTTDYQTVNEITNILIYFLQKQPQSQTQIAYYCFLILHSLIYYHHDRFCNQSLRLLIQFSSKSKKKGFEGMEKLVCLFLINYEPTRTAQLVTQQEASTILDELFIEEQAYHCLYEGPIFVTLTLQLLTSMLEKFQNINRSRFQQQLISRIHFMMGAIILVLDRIYEYHWQKQIHRQLNSPKIIQILYKEVEKSDRQRVLQAKIKVLDLQLIKQCEYYPPFMMIDQFEKFRSFMKRQIIVRKKQSVNQWMNKLGTIYFNKLHIGDPKLLQSIVKIRGKKYSQTKVRKVWNPTKILI